MRFLISFVLLGISLNLGGCQAPKSFATPDASWNSHIGQLKYTDRRRTVIGDVVVQQRGEKEFQLDFQKTAGIPLISIRADATNTRVEGILSHGAWQGPSSKSAPVRLRPWVALGDAFAHPGSRAGYWGKADSKTEAGHLALLFLASPDNYQRFVFQFGR